MREDSQGSKFGQALRARCNFHPRNEKARERFESANPELFANFEGDSLAGDGGLPAVKMGWRQPANRSNQTSIGRLIATTYRPSSQSPPLFRGVA